MKSKAFRILLLSVVGVCAALTLVHVAYATYAYQHGSIIYFIGKELW